MCQELYEKAKVIINDDAWLKFYNEKELWFLETDALNIGLGAGLLQVAVPMIWCTWQHCIALYIICKQEPDQCRNKI